MADAGRLCDQTAAGMLTEAPASLSRTAELMDMMPQHGRRPPPQPLPRLCAVLASASDVQAHLKRLQAVMVAICG